METQKTIYQKLHVIQSQIIGLGKDKASNSYQYVTGSKVLEYIKPLMNDLGLILKQEIISIDNERQDYLVSMNYDKDTKLFSGGKPKSEILTKVMMRFTWIDIHTGETDINMFGANGQNDWEKGLGSALTYAERYFLLKYFHIATDEDDIDNPERKEEERKEKEQKEKENIRLNAINKILLSCETIEDLQKTYTSLKESDKKIFAKIVTEIKNKLTIK